jgi:retron-type reverse transcriptase
MRFEQLISHTNLELAWRRITTGVNQQQKRYFRELYYAYEIAIDANLKDLRLRLKGGSYFPQAPTRLYIPKPSGLQRPLTLLSIEDQIILQAIANLFAVKLGSRRKSVQFKFVFSNLLQPQKSSIFFLHDWHHAYRAFQARIKEHFEAGLRWVAHFDLAAFYDTIGHDLLLRTTFPRIGNTETKKFILNCLMTWSSERATSNYGHGLPQGPIASDFLAECFLLPIEEALSRSFAYIRYVDDIRIFGPSEIEMQKLQSG